MLCIVLFLGRSDLVQEGMKGGRLMQAHSYVLSLLFERDSGVASAAVGAV